MNEAANIGGDVKIPFDTQRLDRLMEEAGIDVLVATSKHNVQYLLGGYRFIFFSAMDAIGHSRYLPVVIYEKGRPDRAAYIGNPLERDENQNHPFWTPTLHTSCWGTVDAAEKAAQHILSIDRAKSRIGIEPGFMPIDASGQMKKLMGDASWIDASGVLERLRAVKTETELDLLREASERITDSMVATIAWAGEGSTKGEIIECLRREETSRGLQFEYCLLTLGSSLNRASSPQAWQPGEVLSIDSGGNYKGYIGDLCRMGVLGEPDAELQDLLGQVDTVQQAAFSKIRAGNAGGEVIAAGQEALARIPEAKCTDFFAHGMGVITHEVPFLTTNHPVAYEGVDADRPLQAGMVLSVETTMMHPRRGFIKLEDTLAVRPDGFEMFGERGRGWNRGGLRA
jgi:Xaa-Pro aminopeptidase